MACSKAKQKAISAMRTRTKASTSGKMIPGLLKRCAPIYCDLNITRCSPQSSCQWISSAHNTQNEHMLRIFPI